MSITLELFLIRDVPEKVNEGADIPPMRRHQYRAQIQPYLFAGLCEDLDIASADRLLSELQHFLQALIMTDDPARFMTAVNDLVAEFTQNLSRCVAKELLSGLIPKDNPVLLVYRKYAIGRVREKIQKIFHAAPALPHPITALAISATHQSQYTHPNRIYRRNIAIYMPTSIFHDISLFGSKTLRNPDKSLDYSIFSVYPVSRYHTAFF